MRADQDLTTGATLGPGEHLGEVTDHVGVKRQLRLFEQERSDPVLNRPEQPQEPQRAVGELVFRLPRIMRPPVLIPAAQVGRASDISPQFEFLELRHGHSQRVSDAAQACHPGLLGGASHLLQEIATKRIVVLPHGSVRLPH